MSDRRPWSYDRAVTHGFFRDTRPDDVPFFDRFTALALAAAAAVVVAGSLAYRAAFPVRLAIGIGIVAAGLLLMRVFLPTYEAAIVRAHVNVVDRPELGEVRRWVIFGLALVGYPLLLLALLIGGIAAAQALNR